MSPHAFILKTNLRTYSSSDSVLATLVLGVALTQVQNGTKHACCKEAQILLVIS